MLLLFLVWAAAVESYGGESLSRFGGDGSGPLGLGNMQRFTDKTCLLINNLCLLRSLFIEV